MSGGCVSRFMKKAYDAYLAFMRSFVKVGDVWQMKKGDVIVGTLLGEKPEELSAEEYQKAAGRVILRLHVHVDAVDGFRKNRSLLAKTVSSFESEFRSRGFLYHEPIYGVLLLDGMIENDSGVTVVKRSGHFKHSICEVDRNVELSICVIGGNHRVKALKALGANFELGCEDPELAPHLAAMYLRGNGHKGYYPMQIIGCPPEIAGLVEWASLDNIKNNVSWLECYVVNCGI
jgi:hypothetical protein